jgi:CheY-like chemotaxis protein
MVHRGLTGKGFDMLELDPMSPPSEEKWRDPREDAAGTSAATPRQYGILIVDDEANIRDLLNFHMRQEGFAVLLAASGQEACDLYRHHHETIDVVLMDVRMPELDGPQTLAALQDIAPQIRCCFMSGDLGSYSAEELRNRGAAAILTKPFDLPELARSLLALAREAFCTAPALAG